MAQRKRHRSRRVGRGLAALPRWQQVVGCVVVVAVLAAVGVGMSLRSGGFEVERSGEDEAAAVSTADGRTDAASTSEAVEAGSGVAEASCFVHVDGAVQAPGVYELAGESVRVCDAVEAAGGLSPEADVSGLNLAAKITDGTKVHVPTAEEAAAAQQSQAITASDGGGSALSSASQSSSSASSLVNINTATVEELDTLPGVGPSTAQAIVEDREANGPFSSVEDLMRVSGIGEKKFAKLEGSICV